MIDFCSIPFTFKHHVAKDSPEMMSKLLDESGSGGDKTIRNVILAAVGVSVAAVTGYGVYKLVRQYLENTPPKQWRRVGELTDLHVYPIKSCGAIRLTQMDCSTIGPKLGLLRDRIFMVIQTDGTFITGRSHPKLVLVQPRFDDQYETMTLSAPGMMDIAVDVKRLFSVEPVKASVWGQTVTAVDCGEELARWLSRFLLSEDFGLRLVFYPLAHPTRPVREKNLIHINLTPRDSGALHDATSFMLVSEASVADVNARVDKPCSAVQYRPNFVVKGPGAFEEDDWKWIKIGETVYRNVKACTRCIFTNVDPETGIPNSDGEPLKTLKSYRKKPGLGDSPVVGMQMGVRREGTVRLGDAVYVGC
ncbi:mitochondrial amidoxime-reducing component 1 isoform X2 [Culex quinquefasciatus]|uniref:mitochondrial amidoxime-reducing component 1 isoform X2 n=2 Tax=Culex quinquefasciatus TaxID=7176 RepID=UPI0018E2B6CF|nr:mitochondrial amidoxime-reducing component 1 isoform X2 [Culex quinquefasciatus]XP_039436325.1 mitochondrial amidoxime-reducing component 1-like isoform X2 [Culex pipiens pallens]